MVIKNSKVYRERRKKRLELPNYIFLRDASNRDPNLEDINRKYGKRWAAVVGMPLEKGIAKSAGMSLINVHERNDLKEDFNEKADYVEKALSNF